MTVMSVIKKMRVMTVMSVIMEMMVNDSDVGGNGDDVDKRRR